VWRMLNSGTPSCKNPEKFSVSCKTATMLELHAYGCSVCW
jgi:hypothetical protein